MANNQEELLRQYYELHPELAPKKPGLDPMFLENLLQNKGNPIPEPPMSVGSDAPFYSEADHPMSIGQPAKTELPPIQEVLAQKPQQTLTREPQQMPIRQSSDEEAMGGMLSKPQDPTNDIMFGKNDLSTVDNLKKAQQARDSNQNSAKMLRGAALAGEGLLGLRTHRITGPDKDPNRSVNTAANKIADDLEKNAGQPIQDLEQQVAMQKQDPNSAVSKGYRDMMKQFGVNVQGDASAADMEKIAPWITKAYEGEQGRENQRILVGEKAKDRAAYLQGKSADKASLEKDHFIERASKNLGAVAKDYAKVRQAAQLADGMNVKNGVAQVTALYNLISSLDPQSTVREGEVHLATSAGGLSGKIDTVLSQLSADPQLIDEKTVQSIKSEIKRIAEVQKGNYEARSQVFRNQAKSRGVEDRFNEIDPYSEENMSSSGYSDSQEKGIQRVMDTNKVSREEAVSALKKAGKL